jgi:hypothetical protein
VPKSRYIPGADKKEHNFCAEESEQPKARKKKTDIIPSLCDFETTLRYMSRRKAARGLVYTQEQREKAIVMSHHILSTQRPERKTSSEILMLEMFGKLKKKVVIFEQEKAA